MNQEVKTMFEKGSIQKVIHSPREFLSNFFLVDKSDGKEEAGRKSEEPKCLYPISTLQDRKPTLQRHLQEGDFMCKIDRKDAYFSVAIDKSHRAYLRFVQQGNLYEFLCLCFGLGPAPLIFTKLLKVPIALLRQLNICLIIYLDDIIKTTCTLQDVLFHQDTVIFFPENLGFVLNLRKSVLEPIEAIEFLGVTIDSFKMNISNNACQVDCTIQTNLREQRSIY